VLTKVNPQEFQWEFDSLDGCPVCHSAQLQVAFEGAIQGIPLRFSNCRACQVTFQNPRPTEACMARFYSSTLFSNPGGEASVDDAFCYYDYDAYERGLKRNAPRLLRGIGRFKPPPAKLLEIGGATGWFMDAARTAGYDVQGLDISEALAQIARDRYQLSITVAPIERSPLPADAFDIVCSFGGIECWRDVVAGCRNVHSMLKRDGIFYFNYIDRNAIVGKLTGKNYAQYAHGAGYLYSGESMHAILDRAGFKIVDERMPWTYVTLGPIFSYFKLPFLFGLFKRLGMLDVCLYLPNIQARTIVAVKK
jgi:SAM-dependent methyltransferase